MVYTIFLEVFSLTNVVLNLVPVLGLLSSGIFRTSEIRWFLILSCIPTSPIHIWMYLYYKNRTENITNTFYISVICLLYNMLIIILVCFHLYYDSVNSDYVCYAITRITTFLINIFLVRSSYRLSKMTIYSR